ncbi:chorismate mutase [Acidiplasma sp.]|nr:chorismate mutase [Acidiplasma sp.]
MELISDFENLRREMLENSREIIRLLKQRIKLAQKIGEIKKMNGGEIHDYNREREIIKLISGDRFTQSVLNILF